jgi:hypothetical protein
MCARHALQTVTRGPPSLREPRPSAASPDATRGDKRRGLAEGGAANKMDATALTLQQVVQRPSEGDGECLEEAGVAGAGAMAPIHPVTVPDCS